MASPHTDPELQHWLHWAVERGNTPTFVRTVAKAAVLGFPALRINTFDNAHRGVYASGHSLDLASSEPVPRGVVLGGGLLGLVARKGENHARPTKAHSQMA
jgi:hypothetical protein